MNGYGDGLSARERAFQQGVQQMMSGAQQGFSAWGAHEQKQENLAKEAEQNKRARALESFKMQQSLASQGVQMTPGMQSQIDIATQTGDYGSLGGLFSDAYAGKTQRDLDLQNQQRDQKAQQQQMLRKQDLADEQSRRQFEMNKLGMQYDYKNQQDLAKQEKAFKKQEKAQSIPGFAKVDKNFAIDKKGKEELIKLSDTNKNITSTAKALIQNIQDDGITSGFGLTDADRKASQNIKNLQLQMKELFNLGVLNGPDLDILDQALGRVQGPIDMMNPANSKQDAIDQVVNVIRDAEARIDNASSSRGYAYEGEKFDENFLNKQKQLTAVNAGQGDQNQVIANEISKPERVQIRNSRIRELKAKQQMGGRGF